MGCYDNDDAPMSLFEQPPTPKRPAPRTKREDKRSQVSDNGGTA